MVPPTDNLNNNELTIRHLTDGFSYVLVPAALYQEKNKEKYLDFLGIKEENSVVCVDYIELADAYNVYCMPKPVDKDFRHPTSVLLESLIKDNLERTDDARIYLNVKNQCFEMIVLKEAKLLFYNYFRFKTKEDFLYFLLFSVEQLHLVVALRQEVFGLSALRGAYIGSEGSQIRLRLEPVAHAYIGFRTAEERLIAGLVIHRQVG